MGQRRRGIECLKKNIFEEVGSEDVNKKLVLLLIAVFFGRVYVGIDNIKWVRNKNLYVN